jgi:hypothetical protein
MQLEPLFLFVADDLQWPIADQVRSCLWLWNGMVGYDLQVKLPTTDHHCKVVLCCEAGVWRGTRRIIFFESSPLTPRKPLLPQATLSPTHPTQSRLRIPSTKIDSTPSPHPCPLIFDQGANRGDRGSGVWPYVTAYRLDFNYRLLSRPAPSTFFFPSQGKN